MESNQGQALPGKAQQAAAGWEGSASESQIPLAEPQRRGPDCKIQPWCYDTLSPVLGFPTFSVERQPSLEPGNGQQGSQTVTFISEFQFLPNVLFSLSPPSDNHLINTHHYNNLYAAFSCENRGEMGVTGLPLEPPQGQAWPAALFG